MKKTKFHRLLAFALALCFLIGGMLTFTVSANTAGASSGEDDGLAAMREELNAITYEEYKERYFDEDANVLVGENAIVIPGQNYVVDATTAVVEVVKNEAGEVEGLYTPNDGVVTWEIPGITRAVRYSVVIEYYPNEAKTTSIERVLKINGKIPFAEARYVTLPKIWKNLYVAARVTADDKTPEQLYAEATTTGGFSAGTVKDGYLELAIPETWTAANSEFVAKYNVRFMETDMENNELRPKFKDMPEWRSYELRDTNGFYLESFEFVFEPGEDGKTTISLEAVNEPMTVKNIKLIKHEGYNSYQQYLANLTEEERKSGQDTIVIQSEYNSAASTQTVYPIEDRSDAATQPCDTGRVVLNTIGGEKWQTSGQWLRYSFRVSSSGMYDIAARFRQNVLDGMYVNRALYIYSEGVEAGQPGYYNGIPYAEAGQFRFNYSADWQSSLMNATDEKGNLYSCSFYFKEGVTYTIEIEVTLGSMGTIVREVEAALKSINNDYLAILKLTGASPDEFRDYGFSRIMPEVMIDMSLQAEKFKDISKRLEEITGGKSSNTATLDKIVNTLETMSGDEREIAKYLSQLKSYIGSLGTWLSDAKTQPLQLDYMVIQPLNSELPKPTAGFFASIAHEVKSFIMSFFRNYNEMGAMEGEGATNAGSIDVWIATGRDQAQVLRNLINNDFTPKYGHSVNLQLVAGGTLLPSVLAGMGPDVYIGVSEDTVINYAIRGALLPIEDMPNFADFALEYKVKNDGSFQKEVDENGNYIFNPNSEFNEAAMIVMGIEDAQGKFHYYGLPEAQGFSMMFLRKDVLAELGIGIPKTWDDVLEAVPILQANNMEIGMHQDYKIFLYQMGGELFADDGMRINLDSNMGLEAFDTMCSYFTMYSFPVSYDFANRFRTGEMPIGFAGYTGTYNQLTVFATEIDGLWEFYPMPGLYVYDADGEPVMDPETGKQKINNVAVSTSSAIVMMADGYGMPDDKDEKKRPTEEVQAQRLRSWDFMVWHVGFECQRDYANEMVAIMGPSAKHSTANKRALYEMPWTTKELTQLRAQFENLASIPNYPGSYIISRYTNFAFLAAYNDNANPIIELQSYISTINKEITRKRAEFGLETLELGQTLLEKRLLQVNEAYEKDTKDMNESQIAAAAAALQMMNDGIRKENAEMLASAADMFKALTGFENTATALKNAETVMRKYQQ